MPRSVERWLETFMCKQYADIFDACGYKSLHSVCQLQIQQLQSMRIPPEHCELIMQNVQILRQSMGGGMLQQQHQFGEEMGPYNNNNNSNRMPPHVGMQGVGYQPRGDMGPMNMSSGYGSQMGGNVGGYGNQRSAMMSQQQYSSQAMYHQQMRQQQQQQQQQQQYKGPLPHHQYPGNQGVIGMSPHNQSKGSSYGEGEINYPPNSQNSPGKVMFRQGYSGKVQGSIGQGQGNSVHHTHPHLRNTGQNPQEVANNILQMASSNYPPSHTVQVPLSKNRSAPYHVPPRSPQYGPQDTSQPQPQQQHYHSNMTSSASQGQFVYPTSSPHHQQQQQQHTRMSPVSPASGVMGMLPSPHSHHSGHSISSSSPCSMHSPGSRDMQSPVSDMNTSMRRTPSGMMSTSQQMTSPQRGQYPISSPSNTPHHQRMVSPVPTNQQLQVTVPCSSTQQQQPMYRDNMSGYSGSGSHSHVQSMSQFPTSCSSQLSPGSQSGHSSSGHSGNVSSPYHNPGAKMSAGFSPNQSYTKQQQPPSPQSLGTNPNPSNNVIVNPLQSLQKLCMLPERQVVDPKSVVNDACAPSPQSNEFPKNYHMNADSQDSDFGMEGIHSESASSNMDSQCIKQRYCVTPPAVDQIPPSYCTSQGSNIHSVNDDSITTVTSESCASYVGESKDPTKSKQEENADHLEDQLQPHTVVSETEEVRCQPKKMMLLRATKEEFNEHSFPEKTETSSSRHTELEKVEVNNDQSDRSRVNESTECSDTVVNLNSPQADTSGRKLECENQQFDESISDSQKVTAKENICESEIRTESRNENESSYCENLNENSAEDIKEEDATTNCSEKETENSDEKLETNQPQEESLESAIDSKNIETETTNIQSSGLQMKYMERVSDSDSESQLTVRKDIKSTYSKLDRLKSIDSTVRSRGHSTGSLSDEIESEMEYEDHIGCDDIENDFSYSDEKEDIVEIEEAENPEIMYEMNKPIRNNVNGLNGVNKDKAIVTSPHWKKSKLSDLQAVDSRNGTLNKGKKSRARRRASYISGLNDDVDLDCDDDIPSPSGVGMLEGMSLDNGNGTLTVTGATRVTHRQRKTPLKFKDSSFYQGDFIFEEEEEGEDEIYIPKKKCAKKTNSMDFNHNTKRNEDLKKKSKCDNKSKLTKTDSLKDKKQKQNFNAKSKQFKSKVAEDDHTDSETDKGVVNGTSDENGKVTVAANSKKTKTKSGMSFEKSRKPGRRASQNGHDEKAANAGKNDVTKKPVRTSKKNEPVRQEAPTKTNEPSKQKPQTVVRTRESLRSKANVKSETKEEDESVFNGVLSPVKKIESEKCENSSGKKKDVKKINGLRSVIDQQHELKIEDELKIEVNDEDSDSNVILIDDEDSVDAVVTRSESKDSELVVTLDIKNDSETERIAFKSDIYESENKAKIVKTCRSKPGVDFDESPSPSVCKKGKGKQGTLVKKTISKAKSASDECKSSSSKKKSASKSKRNKYYDNDSDYELGSSKKSMQAMNLNQTHNLLTSQKKKERREKLAEFKGPVIRLEGAKETPDKCIVINDPFDHTTDLKKKKMALQTVTSIHISHLPPDKSVLMPHNESEEGHQWVCALCGKHSSYKFLGDLFGPYTVENLAEDMSDFHSNFGRPVDSRKRKSDGVQPGSSKSSRSSKRVSSISKELEFFKEVWVHEECAVWSDGVFLIGDKIYGLQEAVRIASQTPCSHCQEMGAMIGCLNKGCQQKFHQSCAMERECFLDEENFSLLCPKHKVRKLKQLEMAAVSGTVT